MADDASMESTSSQFAYAATDDAPCAVRVRGFVRPFVLAGAKALIEGADGAAVPESLRFDKFRTTAVCRYVSAAAAATAAAALDGRPFPEGTAVKLAAEVVSRAELEETVAGWPQPVASGRHDKASRFGERQAARRRAAAGGGGRITIAARGSGSAQEKAPSGAVGFDRATGKRLNRTETLPHLYWLPVEGEVVRKRLRGGR